MSAAETLSAPATQALASVEEADLAVARAAAPLMDLPVTRALGHASEIADQPPMFALGAATALLGLAAGRPHVAEIGLRVLASVALATAMKTAVKRAVGRTRPYVLAREGRYETALMGPVEKDWNSFPSGHTADAVAAARALARALPEAAPVAYAAAAAVALIQIPRCAHYPSDVGAGAAVGWAAEALAHQLLEAAARAADQAG